MTPEEFDARIKNTARQIEHYREQKFPTMAGNIALRFVDGNFRAQGWQGHGFGHWKPNSRNGRILIRRGHLRAATYFTTQIGQATLKNSSPYAKVHNEGFKGTVSIKEHSRNRMAKGKFGTGSFTKKGKERQVTKTWKIGQTSVKAHTRQMNIPQRQFFQIRENDSPILNNAIDRNVARDLKTIITT